VEAIIVSFVSIAFLFHFRSALVAIITLPIAVLAAFIPMYYLNVSSNIMSLGGLALAIGVLIDAAIVMVENGYKHVAERSGLAEGQHTSALQEIERRFGKDRANWQWGKLHQLTLAHPSGRNEWKLGPVARPGDANTVNATSGANFQQTNGASWREIVDVGDWDRSVMTNVPGESGDPSSRHYSDLLQDWAAGKYHPLPFSRRAVEAAKEETIVLQP